MPPSAQSRYRFADGILDTDGNLWLYPPDPYPYRELDDTREHPVIDGDTLWALAARYFPRFDRASELFWVIADFQPQPIIDPTIRLEAGTVLYIPSERTLTEEILNEARRLEVVE